MLWLLQLHDSPSHANSKNAVDQWLQNIYSGRLVMFTQGQCKFNQRWCL